MKTTNKQNINKLIGDYTVWLKQEITITNAEFGEFCEITVPYLDRFNDYLQIYVKQDAKGKITMTDDGYIINNLNSSGVTLRTNSKRKAMLDKILHNFSLSLEKGAITAIASPRNFAQKKHNMVQAMLHIDDMFTVSQSNVGNFFAEDIETFFETNKILFSRNILLRGKTGNTYTYDFHFQKTLTKAERFCKAINKLDKPKRDLTIFNWIDTRLGRCETEKLIVILNDSSISEIDTKAFEEYDIKSILFSEMSAYEDLFAA